MTLNKFFKILFLVIVATISTEGVAQEDFQLYKDHDAVLVKDLEKAAKFYSDILGLKEIYNAGLGERFRWFELNDHVQIHLILSEEDIPKSKNIHLALNTDNLEGFIDHLRKNKVYFENWTGEPDTTTIRPDKVMQIYLKDPDGYWIEINDNKFK